MNFDADLKAIQDVRDLCHRARAAEEKFKDFSQEQVDQIVAAMAAAGFAASEKLAQMAVRETGYGNVEDKIKKNQFGTRDIYESIRDLRTVGIVREDHKTKTLEIAEPMGVVAAIIPTTNPTSTAMFKILIALKARNSIVISPHPRAAGCILASANILNDAALKAGAPDGLIGVITSPTLQATQELMHNRDIDIILATGGTGLVRAAYSAGKPAYGVGPGNVPAYIHSSADYRKAVADIVAGKTFDNGTLCSSEQAVIVDAPLKSRVIEALQAEGAYFMSADETRKLENILLGQNFLVNPNMVGKSARVLAEAAGFVVPQQTRALVAELQGVGKSYPLSAEKLSPVLAFYVVDCAGSGIQRAVDLLNFGGRGHTASVHAKDDSVIREYGLGVPASRVVVNSPASVGAVGYTNSLLASMTLGCGSYGRNITTDNISAHHLMNIKRVAYETKPYAEPRNGTTWQPSVRHDWENRQAPYMKSLSSEVSRKGGSSVSQPKPAASPNPNPETKPASSPKYGASGITETEIERIVDEFVRGRKR